MAEEKDDVENMTPEQIAELQKKNCIFCKIAQKDIPAKIISEDEDIICILDINPASEGHILVYPKKHYMIVPHLPDELIKKLFHKVKLISNLLLKSLQCQGTSIFIANGSAAGQKSPHVLIHVFPRRENDGLVKLPKYEMNAEQVSKLKKEFKPYIEHVFGSDNDDDDESDGNYGGSEDDVDKDDDKKESRKKEPVKKSKEKEKESLGEEKEPKKPGKISLDDIQKLFG